MLRVNVKLNLCTVTSAYQFGTSDQGKPLETDLEPSQASHDHSVRRPEICIGS